jgi:hypothetical protein
MSGSVLGIWCTLCNWSATAVPVITLTHVLQFKLSQTRKRKYIREDGGTD